jgi:hypothetical protein
MSLWRFFDYVTEDGHDLVEEWFQEQDPEVRARFKATLLILRGTEDWEDPSVKEFKPLTKEHKGLGEVRFHVEALAPGATRRHRRRFRPVGPWPPEEDRRFVLILGCEKSRMTCMESHKVFDSALRYKALLGQGKGTIRERII